jgi:uncharacterized protein (DUF1499 family)
MKTCVHLCRDLCEVRAEGEETVDDLKLKTETDCVVCEVRPEAEGTVDDLKLKTETDCVVCEVRAKAEETVDDLKLKTETVLSVRYEVRPKKRLTI